MMFRSMVLLALGWATLGMESGPAADERFWLVRDGVPTADIYASTAEWDTAEWLVKRIQQWTGQQLLLLDADAPLPASRASMGRLLLGTTEGSDEITRVLGADSSFQNLNDEGYALLATTDPPRLIVAGRSSIATRYAAAELLNYRLEVTPTDVWCEPFEVFEQPALPSRWFWISTSYAHWDDSYGGPHITDEMTRTHGPLPDGTDLHQVAYPGQMMGEEPYVDTYKAMIDWMSEHKLNGAMIFGYLSNGLEPAREIAAYGQKRGVGIIAGVGTMSYWGAYYGGNNIMNLDTLVKIHPEWQVEDERGIGYLCPSIPEVQAYWRRAGGWLAEALPELDGLYLENGDFMMCPCDVCAAARALPENDTRFYWDMMASSVPFIEGSSASQPDWNYVYATYTGFGPEALAKGTDHVPPRFPEQFPTDAICQWTVTGLNESNWPEDLKAPTQRSVGLFHSPSVWGTPDGEDRWWAGPGSSHDDASRLVRFYCNRMAETGFEGLIVKGMKNHHSPGPMLTYLALGEFSWHPDRTIEEWETERLGRLFGGRENAATYLRLARDSSRDPEARREMIVEAVGIANSPELSPRARPYWQDLVTELEYRARLNDLLLSEQEKEKD